MMPNVLTSWKEIAQYLGKGVRTVQRWESLYKMPIRRATGDGHHAILAIPEELDAWLRSSTGFRSGAGSLEGEVAALRAENAWLRRQLDCHTVPALGAEGFSDTALVQSSTVIFDSIPLGACGQEGATAAGVLRARRKARPLAAAREAGNEGRASALQRGS